jgi:hypothetical protein
VFFQDSLPQIFYKLHFTGLFSASQGLQANESLRHGCAKWLNGDNKPVLLIFDVGILFASRNMAEVRER